MATKSSGYTKIDVAEAHVTTAVRLFFEDAHPIPIYTLACSAREILTTLGDKLGIETFLHDYAKSRGLSLKDVLKRASGYVGFLKHADRDPAGVLAGFTDADSATILFVACHDFGRVTGGMPVEAQVFESWYFATTVKRVSDSPPKRQELIKQCIRLFRRVRSVARPEQKRIGLRVLEQARQDPALQMDFRRTVETCTRGQARVRN